MSSKKNLQMTRHDCRIVGAILSSTPIENDPNVKAPFRLCALVAPALHHSHSLRPTKDPNRASNLFSPRFFIVRLYNTTETTRTGCATGNDTEIVQVNWQGGVGGRWGRLGGNSTGWWVGHRRTGVDKGHSLFWPINPFRWMVRHGNNDGEDAEWRCR